LRVLIEALPDHFTKMNCANLTCPYNEPRPITRDSPVLPIHHARHKGICHDQSRQHTSGHDHGTRGAAGRARQRDWSSPVVFIHGLWLLPSSWDRWAAVFEEAGYTALTPGWPDDPETVSEANAHPEVFANKTVGQVADHFAKIAGSLKRKPVVIGHSFGGLLSQILAGRGLSAASVAIDPAPFRGVLPLPFSALKSAWPVLGNPANRSRAVPLTYDQFRYAFANIVSEEEAQQLYKDFAVPAAGAPLFQAAVANFNPWTEAKVDHENPDRGPLLIISGEKDHVVPWAIANASFKQQEKNGGVTEIVEMKNRGHGLTIDNGWREVAETALSFVKRFA
jgi:pimeloyl-ACP methyl ester carboxylesterase